MAWPCTAVKLECHRGVKQPEKAPGMEGNQMLIYSSPHVLTFDDLTLVYSFNKCKLSPPRGPGPV